MEKVFLKYPKALFWAVVCVSVAACWLARLAFVTVGVWNNAIAFNIPLPPVFIYIITISILGGLVTWLMRMPSPKLYHLWGIALVVGGGSANLIDRLLNHGLVWDYIPFGPIGHFNLADVCVTVGLALLVYNWWKEEKKDAQA